MKIVLVFSQQDENFQQLVENYFEICDNSVLFSLIITDENFDQSVQLDGDNITWFSKDEWHGQKNLLQNEILSCTLAEAINGMADSLAYSGEPVKCYLFLPEDVDFNSHLGLYGALYRLKLWHNVKPTFVTTSDCLTESVLSLTQFLEADIIDEMKLDEEEPVIWSGKVTVMNKIEDKGYQFAGFNLSCDDIECLEKRLCFHHSGQPITTNNKDTFQFGRMIEILDDVDMSTIPTFLLTPLTLNLHVNIENMASRIFLQDVHNRHAGTALVGRIATYKSTDIPTCGSKHLKTSFWKEAIMNDITCVQEPEEEHLPGFQYLHFIVTKHPGKDEHDMAPLKLTVLKSPKEINKNLLTVLEKSDSVTSDSDIKTDFLSSLPCINNLDLTLLHDHLNQIQVGLLKEWIDEREEKNLSTVISQHHLLSFIESTQSQFMTALFHTYQHHEEIKTHDITCIDINSDLDIDPAMWPERLALQYYESKQKTIRRFKSSDSMPLSSPFYPQESGTSLDAVEFLRYFQADGTAINDKMSPVRKKSTGRTVKRFSSHDSLTSWPESKDANYHDVYYYSKKEDNHFAKVRDKFMKEETYCSLYTPFYGKTKSKKIESKMSRTSSGHILSPTRRSPRGKKRKHTDNVKSSSQTSVKQNVGLRTPTKLAQRQLKSPKKRPSQQSPRKRVTSSQPLRSSPRKGVRQSPRKAVTASRPFDFSGSQVVRKLPAPFTLDEDSNQSNVFGNFTNIPAPHTIEVRKKKTIEAGQSSKAGESRSQRHRRKLEEICTRVLELNGVDKSNSIFKSCSSNLYQVTKFFVKALPNAHSLSQEMRRIAEGQVLQVIDLEKRRQELSQKKKKT
ncbi:hypothetical protein SNE40_007478 [Patella caerulea]|uniref:MDN2-binding protein C-terminal domain-containing protein n=1 Tax=Patella caerulea TaxID=87958 RepID=A0AAN8Q8B8_PATCE